MYEVLKKKKYLAECKKIFNKHNLKFFKGKYPFCYEDNIGREKTTPQQDFVCDLLLKKGYHFIVEYKTIAQVYNHFYSDILVKGKHHLISLEINGKHHSSKFHRIRDLKKATHLVEYKKIYTIEIDNEIVDNYYNNKQPLEDKLKGLNFLLFDGINKTERRYISEKLGYLKMLTREAKSEKGKKKKKKVRKGYRTNFLQKKLYYGNS